jgi:3-isopropylmalate/(R)-2-methylmalate dehydratase small subunit
MREPVTRFTSRYVALRVDDVDTDQIIPARFLTTTERTGLGAHLFHDWRYLADGQPNPKFALGQAPARGAKILVAGRNFGCGSSREHAVWALQGAGFQAVISESFGDIFRANALGNGLLPLQVDHEVSAGLLQADPTDLTVDLADQALSRAGAVLCHFPVAPFVKHCLLRGIDELEFLLDAAPTIAAFESRARIGHASPIDGAPRAAVSA